MIEQLAQDNRLSFEARGAMLYILSMGENAQIKPVDLMRAGGIGRAQTYRILSELRAAGYMQYTRVRHNGRYVKSSWTICPTALEAQPPLQLGQK